MNNNQIFYRATIQIGKEIDYIIVRVFYSDRKKSIINMEFYRLSGSIKNEGFSIPSKRQATFQEELRILNKARSIIRCDIKKAKNLIKEKIKEAYCEEAKVCLKNISENMEE